MPSLNREPSLNSGELYYLTTMTSSLSRVLYCLWYCQMSTHLTAFKILLLGCLAQYFHWDTSYDTSWKETQRGALELGFTSTAPIDEV